MSEKEKPESLTSFILPARNREFERALNGRSKVLRSFEKHLTGVGPLYVVRVPGRLDIMGGIADYSGSVVCEGLLNPAAVLGLQRRKDRQVRVYSAGLAEHGLNPQFEMSLDEFRKDGRLISYAAARKRFSICLDISWAAYIAGCFYTLMEEEGAEFATGADIVLVSNIPMGGGISSSAAIETATLHTINVAYNLAIEGQQLAHLGQQTENRVVGSPCGLMDQLTVTLGREDMIMASVASIVDSYQSRTGIDPDVFAGSSPGALEFGHLEYMSV